MEISTLRFDGGAPRVFKTKSDVRSLRKVLGGDFAVADVVYNGVSCLAFYKENSVGCLVENTFERDITTNIFVQSVYEDCPDLDRSISLRGTVLLVNADKNGVLIDCKALE